eukprot:6890088-Alexandrium_andersonii.AAC.1
MSASLVGSEMCIRDRRLRRASDEPRRAYDQPSRCHHLRPGPGITASPVSYTHLTLPTICSV